MEIRHQSRIACGEQLVVLILSGLRGVQPSSSSGGHQIEGSYRDATQEEKGGMRNETSMTQNFPLDPK